MRNNTQVCQLTDLEASYLIQGKNAQALIEQIYLYMITKREQAEIALQFPIGEDRTVSRKNDQEMLFTIIRQLNKRGRSA